MTIRLWSVVLSAVVVFWCSVASEGLAADSDAAKSSAQDKNEAAAPFLDPKTLADLRTKRDKSQKEVDAVSKPQTLSVGAPAGTPQEEILERRTLLQHIVRSLDEQMDNSLRLDQARRRREDLAKSSTATDAPVESPPYSVFYADQLWDNAYSLRLTVEGLQSQLSLVEIRSSHDDQRR